MYYGGSMQACPALNLTERSVMVARVLREDLVRVQISALRMVNFSTKEQQVLNISVE